jgi:hypothetical protein
MHLFTKKHVPSEFPCSHNCMCLTEVLKVFASVLQVSKYANMVSVLPKAGPVEGYCNLCSCKGKGYSRTGHEEPEGE